MMAHLFAQFFTFLGRQRMPVFHHAATPWRTEMTSAFARKAAEENPGQHEDTQRLPKGNHLNAEDIHEDAVPEFINSKGKHGEEADDEQRDQETIFAAFVFHKIKMIGGLFKKFFVEIRKLFAQVENGVALA